MYKDDDGVFQVCMSTRSKTKSDHGPSTFDLKLIEEMQNAEQALETLLEHATPHERDEAEGVLVAILGAWTCVKRARAMAGC